MLRWFDSRVRHVLALTAVATSLSMLAAAVAAVPGNPLGKLLKPDAAKSAAGSGAAAPGADTVPVLEERLAKAKREVDLDKAGQRLVPPGTTPSLSTETGWLLQRIAALLQSQLDVQREIATVRASRESEDRSNAAESAADSGPFSATELDEQYERLDAERTRLASFESVRTLTREEIARLESIYKERQADERRTREQSPGGQSAALEVAQLRTRRIAEALELLGLQARLNDDLTKLSRQRVAALERRALVMSRNFRFSQEELERLTKMLQERVTLLERQVEETNSARADAIRDRDTARGLIDALPSPTTPAEVRQRVEAETRLHAAGFTLEALRAQQSALSSLRGILPLAAELWKQRYTAINSQDPEARRAAIAALNASFDRVTSLQAYARDLDRLVVTALREQQLRVDGLDPQSPAQRYEQAALTAARRAQLSVGELQVAALKIRGASQHWNREFEAAGASRPVGERLADAWVVIKDFVRQAWDFELFAVEDTINIDGRSSTVSRGVTVGKSVGALLIFVVGFSFARALARHAQVLMVTRFAMADSQAKVLRRWITMLSGFLLLILTLNLARIPLTVFAFMGGALAIGVGFGTQTLLKNLISGVIVLFERKVRVGDIVEVESVQGIVTAVDVRSTTVRQFDGIETMIPNAMLLENKVTNWTGENPTMRRVVKIGVAYGSPTRQVADVLKQSADEHGLVMKEPAPFVIFEDFGDNALVFALYFWVDVAKNSGIQIQSDLRFMLEKRLGEAGIVIAFPQRDVHFDSARPLRVEVVGGGDSVAGTA